MNFRTLWHLNISAIWKLTDQNDFVIAMCSWVYRKSSYGKNMAALTSEEQVLYICSMLEDEVNNGGFSQYLYNPSGDHANRVAECMETIGAKRTAEICRTAMSSFTQPLPENQQERIAFLEDACSKQVFDLLNECDKAFYCREDDLEHLYYLYIQAHRESFC